MSSKNKTSLIVAIVAASLVLAGAVLMVYGQISDYKLFGIGATLLATSVPASILALRK